MPGGLIQLAAYGAQDVFFHHNPETTFFKQVHRTYTNFACESVRLEFNRNDVNVWDHTELTCKIKRYGDLLAEMYLVFELPDIAVTDEFHTARWVRRLGEALIEKATIQVGSAADVQRGEWISVWRLLTLDMSKANIYNRMIGNTPDVYDPDMLRSTVKKGEIFIKGRSVIVPLNFWFNRDYGSALPLQALQYNDVTLTLVLRPLRDLYTVNMRDGAGYVRPQASNLDHGLQSFNSSRATMSSVTLTPYLEANFVFLDEPERNKFATTPMLEYLMDQVTQVNKSLPAAGTYSVDMSLQNQVKEIIWLLRPPDYMDRNGFTEVLMDGVVEKAKIMFNGQNRVEEKMGEYFSLIQPFQHHTSSALAGLYMYSFSLRPELWQPTGSCNMSRISKVTLQLRVSQACELFVFMTPIDGKVDSELRDIAAQVDEESKQDDPLPLDLLGDNAEAEEEEEAGATPANTTTASSGSRPLRVSDLARPTEAADGPPPTGDSGAEQALLARAAEAAPRFARGLAEAQKQGSLLEAVTKETAKVKEEILTLLKGSYADLTLDARISDVVAGITEMVDQSALLMSKFVVVFQAQQASLQEVFGGLTSLASDVRASSERARMEEQKSKMLEQLAAQKEVLRGYGDRLKGFVSARDQEAFQAALRTIEMTR
ncbi:hypothetical protein HXX76_014176 [Chlamydomonas incerta]|uniref:Uncharacterized protein n=1 Tax=Chlamydomonas incerta TaxID=51695 RepID=A0A835SD07_CHLIN|nr:hypothetical protein HXX76_014176 [Chlamydomonas incerta]|eukprot:KAG2425018.1 hypothetical protein HXX76_014176 [Chlamydomonas incerta]